MFTFNSNIDAILRCLFNDIYPIRQATERECDVIWANPNGEFFTLDGFEDWLKLNYPEAAKFLLAGYHYGIRRVDLRFKEFYVMVMENPSRGDFEDPEATYLIHDDVIINCCHQISLKTYWNQID